MNYKKLTIKYLPDLFIVFGILIFTVFNFKNNNLLDLNLFSNYYENERTIAIMMVVIGVNIFIRRYINFKKQTRNKIINNEKLIDLEEDFDKDIESTIKFTNAGLNKYLEIVKILKKEHEKDLRWRLEEIDDAINEIDVNFAFGFLKMKYTNDYNNLKNKNYKNIKKEINFVCGSLNLYDSIVRNVLKKEHKEELNEILLKEFEEVVRADVEFAFDRIRKKYPKDYNYLEEYNKQEVTQEMFDNELNILEEKGYITARIIMEKYNIGYMDALSVITSIRMTGKVEWDDKRKRWVDPYWGKLEIKEIIKKAEEEAYEILMRKNKKEKKRFWGFNRLKVAENHYMGDCHILWGDQKRILKEKYNIDWRTPQEQCPGAKFD